MRRLVAVAMTIAAMGVATTAAVAGEYREVWNPPEVRASVGVPHRTRPHGAAVAVRRLSAGEAGGHAVRAPGRRGRMGVGRKPGALAHASARGMSPRGLASHGLRSGRRAPVVVARSTAGASRHAYHVPAVAAHPSVNASRHALAGGGARHAPPAPLAATHSAAGASQHAFAADRPDHAHRKPVSVAPATTRMPQPGSGGRRPPSSGHPAPRRPLVVDAKPTPRKASPDSLPNPLRRELPPILG